MSIETNLLFGPPVEIAGECDEFLYEGKGRRGVYLMVTYIQIFFGVLPTSSYTNTYRFARRLLPVQPFSGEVNNTWTAMVITG